MSHGLATWRRAADRRALGRVRVRPVASRALDARFQSWSPSPGSRLGRSAPGSLIQFTYCWDASVPEKTFPDPSSTMTSQAQRSHRKCALDAAPTYLACLRQLGQTARLPA